LTLKAPFEEATEEVGKVLAKKGYAEKLFGTKDVDVKFLLDAFIYSEGILSRPLFMYQKVGGVPLEILDHISAFFTANYVPFYIAMKNWTDGILKVFTERNLRRKLVPIASAIASSSFLATLIGAKHTAPFSFLYDLYNVGEQLGALAGADISQETVPPFIWEITKEGYGYLFVKFGTGDLIVDTALGSGILGGILNIRTTAGATTLPSVGDAPLIQLARDIMQIRNQIDLRLRRGEMAEVQKNTFAFIQGLLRTSGFIKKVSEEAIGKVISIAHLPPQNFASAIRNVVMPRQFTEFEPVGISLRDKLTIKNLRERGMDGLSYILGIMRETERRQGVEFISDTAFRKMASILKKGVSADEDDILNFVYLTVIHSYVKGYDGKALLQRTLKDKLNEKLLAYYDDLRKRIELTGRMMRFEGGRR
jgi:hypothetical protein